MDDEATGFIASLAGDGVAGAGGVAAEQPASAPSATAEASTPLCEGGNCGAAQDDDGASDGTEKDAGVGHDPAEL